MDVAYMRTHWHSVRAGLVETIAKLRDDELDFKPYPTAWTIRELLLHVPQEERGERDYGVRQTLDAFPAAYDPQQYATREAIQTLLETVHAETVAYLATLEDGDLDRTIATPWGVSYRLIEMLGHLIEHEIHHRAELSLILGMLGREGLDV